MSCLQWLLPYGKLIFNKSIEFIQIIFQSMSTAKAVESKQPSEGVSQGSLLDITYPYLSESMLAKSSFYGFQVLVYLLAWHFAIFYTVTNYINKGYLIKMDVLMTVANNLIWDFMAISLAMLLAIIQIYLVDLLLRLPLSQNSKRWMIYGYCAFWLCLFVVGALVLISTLQFYFTDRIFIVVCSWAIAVKTSSYCMDKLKGCASASLLTKLKFMCSPKIVYQQFLEDYTPSLRINKRYLLIKALTAFMCLLINYILVTEIIAPYLETMYHRNMSFLELFFRLTPLLFFEHMCLYYLIMENILLAMAQLTQLKKRRIFQDWWNAETIADYFDKWVLLINAFSDSYLPLARRSKQALHLTIIFIMLFSIFQQTITLKMILFAIANICIVFFFGDNTSIQNNYMVHLLTICFQPFWLAAALKYNIFS